MLLCTIALQYAKAVKTAFSLTVKQMLMKKTLKMPEAMKILNVTNTNDKYAIKTKYESYKSKNSGISEYVTARIEDAHKLIM